MFDAKSPNLNAQSDSAKSSTDSTISQNQKAGNKKAASDGDRQGESSSASNHDNQGGEVVVTGNEFGEYKDIKELRKKAVQYYADHLQGTSVENEALGKIDIDENAIVNFTGSGKREFKNSSAKEHKLLLVRYLPKLIRQATNIDGKPSSEDKHDGEYFYYLHTNAKIDGNDTPVDITLVKRNDGSIQYYNHTLPTEENKKDAVVSTGPESSNEALGTPSIPASSLASTIPQNQKKGNKKTANKGEQDVDAVLTPNSKSEYNRLQSIEPIPVKEGIVSKMEGKSGIQSAVDAFAKEYPNGAAPDTVVGKVKVNKKGIKNSLSHLQYAAKYDTVVSLPEGLKVAAYMNSVPDINGQNITNHFLVYPIQYKGKRQYVVCRVRETIGGRSFYIHGIYSMEDIEKKIDALSQTQPPSDGKVQLGGTALYDSIIANFFALGKTAEENKKDLSVPPVQAAQTNDGIPAIDKPSVDSTIPQNQKDSNKKEKNPDGTDVFVRSEPTADGTVSPSEQNPSAPNISQNQTQGNLVLGDKTAVKVFADSLTYDNIQMEEIPQELLSEINGSSNEENLQRAVDYLESRKGKQFTDPLGNQLYFEPGNTESMEQYALHLIAGKDASDEMDLSKVRDSRVLGVLLAQKTLESPLAVVEQKNNHRRVYISIYRGDVNYANSLVIGVEKGQDGRIVTVFMSGSKRDKKAALRELKNRLSGENTEKVLYISDGLYGHSRPTTEPRTSQGSVSLRPSGNQSVPQNQQKGNQKSTSKHSESQGAFSIGKINGKHQAKLETQLGERYVAELGTIAKNLGGTANKGKKTFTFKDRNSLDAFLEAANAYVSLADPDTMAKFSASDEIRKILDGIQIVNNEELNSQQRKLSELGDELGCQIVWIDADSRLNGMHIPGTNVTLLNRRAGMSLQKTFWHETFHWIKANNTPLWEELLTYFKGKNAFTKEQIESYRKKYGRYDLQKDEYVIEELLADAFIDVKQRVPFMQEMARENPSLARKFVAWIKQMMDRFVELFHNPEGRLTTEQRDIFVEAFGKLAGSMVDGDKRKLFKVYNSGKRITLSDGEPLPEFQFSKRNKYSFAGVNAENAPLDRLERAKEMDGKANPDKIYEETGWFKGKDGKWRFEIPDNLDQIDFSDFRNGATVTTLGKIYDNQSLYDAYPRLKDIRVGIDSLSENQFGAYNPSSNMIVLNGNKIDAAQSDDDMKKTLVHEIQHAIQGIEGFAVGGNMRTARDQILGEIRRIVRDQDFGSSEGIEFASLNDAAARLANKDDSFDAWWQAMQDIHEFEKSVPKEKMDKIRRLVSMRKKLSQALDSRSDRYLYENLGGEQEAREVERRAEGHTKAERAYMESLREQTKLEWLRLDLPENQQRQLDDYLKAIDEARASEDDSAWDRVTELEEALPKNVRKAVRNARFSKGAYEMARKDMMDFLPKPHDVNALIVFGGKEFAVSSENDVDNSENIGDNVIEEVFERAKQPRYLRIINDGMNYEEVVERLLEPENIAVSRALSLYEIRERNNDSTTIPRQKLKAFLQVADTRRRALKDERGRKTLHEILRQHGRIREGSNLERTLSGRDIQGIRLSDGTNRQSGIDVKIPGEFGSLYEHAVVKELLQEISEESRKSVKASANLNDEAKELYDKAVSNFPGIAKDKGVANLVREGIQQTLDFGSDPRTDTVRIGGNNGSSSAIGRGSSGVRSDDRNLTLGRRLTGIFERVQSERTDDGIGSLKEKRRGKIYGLGITRQLVNDGAVSLAGKKARDIQELAEIAQVLRHPGYEKFHTVYVDGRGKVKYHETVSCRLPSISKVMMPEDETGAKPWYENFVDRVNANIKKYKAKKVYYIHNHPSGDPTPSSDDLKITKHLLSKTPFAGHIVLDHDTFSAIGANGGVSKHQVLQGTIFSYDVAEIENPALGRQIKGLNDIRHVVNLVASDAETVAFFLDAKLKVRSVQKLHDRFSTLTEDKQIRYLRHCARVVGGNYVVITTSNQNLYKRMSSIVNFSGDAILDVAYIENGRAVESGRNAVVRPQRQWLGIDEETSEPKRVLEDTAQYGADTTKHSSESASSMPKNKLSVSEKPSRTGNRKSTFFTVDSDLMDVSGHIPENGIPFIDNLWYKDEYAADPTDLSTVSPKVLRKGNATNHVLAVIDYLKDKGYDKFQIKTMSEYSEALMESMEEKGYVKALSKWRNEGDNVTYQILDTVFGGKEFAMSSENDVDNSENIGDNESRETDPEIAKATERALFARYISANKRRELESGIKVDVARAKRAGTPIVRDSLRTINKMVDLFNEIPKKDSQRTNREMLATQIEYARRCFENEYSSDGRSEREDNGGYSSLGRGKASPYAGNLRDTSGQSAEASGKVQGEKAVIVDGERDDAKNFWRETFDREYKHQQDIRKGASTRTNASASSMPKNQDSTAGTKFSINASDNSTPSLTHRIKNILAGTPATAQARDQYRRKMARMIEDALGVKIRTGKLDVGRPENGTVVYKEKDKVIRSLHAYDWKNILPMASGLMAERLGIVGKAADTTAAMRNYISTWILTGAPNNTSVEADTFHRAMQEHPHFADRMLAIREQFQEWADKSTQEQMQGIVQWTKEKSPTWKERKDLLYEELVEELAPVEDMVRQYEQETGEKLEASLNPMTAFRLLRGAHGRAITMIEGVGQAAVDGLKANFPNINFDGFKTLHTILDEIGALQNQEKQHDFATYCIAKHILDMHRKNRQNRLEQEKLEYQVEGMREQVKEDTQKAKKMKERLALYQGEMAELRRLERRIESNKNKIREAEKRIESLEGSIYETPKEFTEENCEKYIRYGREKYDQAQKALVHFSNTTAAILADSGVISNKRYQELLQSWPNYVPLFRVFEENKDIDFGDSMKRIAGSMRDFVNPLESIVHNTVEFVKKAEKNKAKSLLADFARCDGIGRLLIEEVDNNSPNTETVITFYENGQRKYLETDPSIVKAVNNMDRRNSNAVLKFLHAITSVARACFTMASPEFAFRNIFRDYADAAVYNKFGFISPMDLARGFMHAFRRDNVYYEWLSSGAAQASAVSLDRNYTQEMIDKLGKTWKRRLASKQFFPAILEALQKASEYSEYATRIAMYEKAKAGLNKGRTRQDAMNALIGAAFESRDLMDFARHGRAGAFWNKLVPFANASIQGMNKFYRTLDWRNGNKKQAVRAFVRLAMSSILPAMLLFLMHHDDDWFKELPDWVKETHWVFKVGDTIIRIPKGSDVGVRFLSNAVEKGMAESFNHDRVKWTEYFMPLYDSLPNFLPIAILPLLEASLNRSTFTGRNIVPQYQEKLPAKMQYGPYTTGMAKVVGEMLGIAPSKVDHVIAGYTGSVGMAPWKLLDLGYGMYKGTRQLDTNITELPLTRALTYAPYKNPKSVQKYYEMLDEQTKLENEFKMTHKRPEGFDPALLQRLKDSKKQMSVLSKQERDLINNPNLTMDERKRRQFVIQQRRIRLVERIIK